MTDRELRRRCERILDDLAAPHGTDVRALCALVGRQQGKPIHLVAESLPPQSPSGLAVRTARFDAIIYEKRTTPLHQEHIIGHELGHILCGHGTVPMIDSDTSRLLLPDLDPALVQAVLGRSNYTQEQEREAEMIASLILRRSVAPPRPGADDDAGAGQDPLLRRLAHTLEDIDRGGADGSFGGGRRRRG